MNGHHTSSGACLKFVASTFSPYYLLSLPSAVESCRDDETNGFSERALYLSSIFMYYAIEDPCDIPVRNREASGLVCAEYVVLDAV